MCDVYLLKRKTVHIPSYGIIDAQNDNAVFILAESLKYEKCQCYLETTVTTFIFSLYLFDAISPHMIDMNFRCFLSRRAWKRLIVD